MRRVDCVFEGTGGVYTPTGILLLKKIQKCGVTIEKQKTSKRKS
jgi:hypothetical protein